VVPSHLDRVAGIKRSIASTDEDRTTIEQFRQGCRESPGDRIWTSTKVLDTAENDASA
jgi:hypothetical protein